MWSNFEKPITDFIVEFEQILGKADPSLKKNLPLDNLQVNILLDQRTQPAKVQWHVSVMNGAEELCDLGHSFDVPS